MKKYLIYIVAIAVGVVTAEQTGFTAVTDSESIRVLKITQSGDFMPGPGRVQPKLHTYIEFQALSNGCTSAKDFIVEKIGAVPETQQLHIIRKNEDFCDGLPHLKTMTLHADHFLPGSQMPIFITNPFYTVERISH